MFKKNIDNKRPVLMVNSSFSYRATVEKRGVENTHTLLTKRHNGANYFSKVFLIEIYTLEKERIELGQNIYVVPFPEKFIFLKKLKLVVLQKMLLFFYYLRKIYKFAKKNDVDFIKAGSFEFRGLLNVILKKRLGIPLIGLALSDYDIYRKIAGRKEYIFLASMLISDFLKKFILKNCDFVICISEYMRQYCIKWGVKPETAKVIYNGRNLNDFKNFSKNNSIQNKNSITFVGRIHAENYVFDVIAISKKIKKQNIPFIFNVVGAGPDFDKLNDQVHEENLENEICLLGKKDNAEALKIMNRSSVVFCPISGFVLIEAGLSYSTVVAYDVEWHTELLKNNYNSFVVPNGDIDSAVNKIIELFNKPELRATFSNRLKEKTVKQHNIDVNTEKEKNYYIDIQNNWK